MITLASDYLTQLRSGQNKPVEVIEIVYALGSTAYFSDQAITWNGNAYQAYVKSRSDIKRYMSGQFDQVSITFSNVSTGMAQFIADNDLEGAQLTIRRIFPTVTDDSQPLFVGLIQKPGAVDEKQCVLVALERLGSMQMDAPTRLFGVQCPWLFKGPQCLYAGGASTCDKSWANCNTLGNTDRYGGFRFLPNSGTFQYQQVTQERFLLFFSRKKTTAVNVAFNAVDDTPYDVPIPIVLGRTQIQGIPIEHEDTGAQTSSSIAFSVGRVDDFLFLTANDELINIARDATLHYGDEGGTGTQLADPRFPGSYPYTLLAYMGLTLASDVTSADGAPAVVVVMRGIRADYYDGSGAWLGVEWTDNPVWLTRKFLSLSYYEGGMGVPDGWLDDVRNYAESQYCDELVADFTNDQKIYLPDPLPTGMTVGENYRRYRSTCVDGYDGTTDGPYSSFVEGVDDDTTQSPPIVAVRRFTMNAAIAQQDTAIDILQSKLLPSFRGYTKQNKLGQIQICVEKAALNAMVTVGAAAGVNSISCDSPSQFTAGDLLILGTYTVNAEMATVSGTTGSAVLLTALTTKSHAIGDELLKVSRAYNDSNVVDKTVIQYPLSDRQTAVNQVSVQYCDAPTGFQPRTLNCNDYDNIDQVHAVNNQVLDGSCIDSYFQAWRVGQWALGLQRDLGKFVSLRAGIAASDLEVGDDIIAVSAAEHGLVCVPFRIIEMGFTPEDEVDLVGQLYDTQIYNDEAPQSTRTVPTVFAPITNVPAGPLPYRPTLSPVLGSLYPDLATFRLYTAPGGQIALYDVPTVNVLSTTTLAPIVPPAAVVTGGGDVPAGKALLALVGVDAGGRKSGRSHFITADVTSGSSTLTVPGVTFDGAAVSWELYYGPDSQHMWKVAADSVANPVTVGVGWVAYGQGLPDTSTYKYRVIITPIRHGGVWGSGASAVAAHAITIPQTATAHAYAGRVLTLYASSAVIASGGIGSTAWDGMSFVRPANFDVTDNDAAGVFTVSQSTLVSGFPVTQAGDVYVLSAQANIASANTIGDSAFVSFFAAGGLLTDAEFGKIVWIKAGLGAGQRRVIVSNTSTILTVDRDWDIIPDATSLFIILESAVQTVECTPFLCDGTGVLGQSLATVAALFTSEGTSSFLVQVVSEDADGNVSSLDDAPWQEVYLDPVLDIVEATVSATPYALKKTNVIMTAMTGAHVVNLPVSTSVHRLPVWAVNTSGVALTFNAAATETIEGLAALTIPIGMRYQLMPGADWKVVAASAGFGATGLATFPAIGDGLLLALGTLGAKVTSGIGIDSGGNIVVTRGDGIALDLAGNVTVNAGLGLTTVGGFLAVQTAGAVAVNGSNEIYIPGGAITNTLLAALAVATANLQNNAVTGGKMANATITDLQCDSLLLQNLFVNSALIGQEVVATANIQALAVTTAVIAHGAVGTLQVSSLDASVITTGTLTVGQSYNSGSGTSFSSGSSMGVTFGSLTAHLFPGEIDLGGTFPLNINTLGSFTFGTVFAATNNGASPNVAITGAFSVTGALSGTHLQNIGTGDSPTFAGVVASGFAVPGFAMIDASANATFNSLRLTTNSFTYNGVAVTLQTVGGVANVMVA